MSQTPSFDRNLTEARALKSFALSAITIFCAILACIPLFSVLYMLILRGGKRLSFELFYALPPTAFDTGGGFGNAILGTLVMVGIASLIAVPFGTLAAIFLAEFGENSKIADIARFCAKTMTGIPSILAGVLAYTAVVMVTGTYSAIAGGIALSLLMIPTVMLTAEESIKMVPSIMREAAVGIGCTKTQVMWKVMLPVAMPGMITGVMLAVARASGETAPLLFTALFSDYWMFQGGAGDIMEPTASLAVLIYNFSGMPFDNQIELAWAASLVLVVIVFIINIASRMLFQKKK
ncbi:MAG TPA: phosphate ABC transporter permease PstA [Desulfocapsa sulfexigens]|nr:phosphate ABC transporter permease PstA [Desulfocapsa sulfexigens]